MRATMPETIELWYNPTAEKSLDIGTGPRGQIIANLIEI
jgi:hypothetical protein